MLSVNWMYTTRHTKQLKWGSEAFLGTSLVKKYQVVLDYGHRRMTLVPPGSTAGQSAGCKGTAVPFSPGWQGKPAAEPEIDQGRLTVRWDTGSPRRFLVRDSFRVYAPALRVIR